MQCVAMGLIRLRTSDAVCSYGADSSAYICRGPSPATYPDTTVAAGTGQRFWRMLYHLSSYSRVFSFRVLGLGILGVQMWSGLKIFRSNAC